MLQRFFLIVWKVTVFRLMIDGHQLGDIEFSRATRSARCVLYSRRRITRFLLRASLGHSCVIFFYKIIELFKVEMKAIDYEVESGDKLTARNMTLFCIPIR